MNEYDAIAWILELYDEQALVFHRALAQELGVDLKELPSTMKSVRQILFSGALGNVISLSTPRKDDDDFTLGDTIKADTPTAGSSTAADELKRKLLTAVKDLPQRDQKILAKLYGLDGQMPQTLAVVGAMLKVSRERIRQVEERSLEYIREKYPELKELWSEREG